MLAAYKHYLTNPSDHACKLACPTDFARNAAENPNLNASKLRHIGLVTDEIDAENIVIQ